MRLISALKEGFEVDLIYFSWGFDTELCRNFAGDISDELHRPIKSVIRGISEKRQ